MGRNRQQYQYYNNQQSYQNYQDMEYEMEDEQGGRHMS